MSAVVRHQDRPPFNESFICSWSHFHQPTHHFQYITQIHHTVYVIIYSQYNTIYTQYIHNLLQYIHNIFKIYYNISQYITTYTQCFTKRSNKFFSWWSNFKPTDNMKYKEHCHGKNM